MEINSRDGFGLLSPTIYNHDGKTIALGIVPDKLPSEDNWNLGWAHCYSLPREWSLNDNGELVQKPYSGLTGLRTANGFERTSFDLEGSLPLDPVSGRAVEIEATFTIGSNPFGFKIFKNSTAEATITYNYASSSLTVDFSRLTRLVNDGGVYNGVYTLTMPEYLRRGSDIKINLFIDHSILDIFINDRWASSIRVFPTDSDANGIEAFSNNGSTAVKSLRAWNLNPSASSGIDGVLADRPAANDGPVNVYTLTGQLIHRAANADEALDSLPAGIYIVDDRKVAKTR